MNKEMRQRRTLIVETCLLALLFGCVSLAFTFAARAQAGRAVRRPTQSPSPSAQPSPQSSPQPSAHSSAHPEVTFIVARFVQSPSLTIETRIAFNGFVERLKQSSEVEVQAAQTEMSRGEAIERAKTEREAYVIWLRTEVDTADSENASVVTINPGCVLVTYTVFSPQTAKIKAQGRVYQRGYTPNVCTASGSRPALPPTERRRYDLPYEERLRRAGHEAANRVMQAFNLRLPTN
jgi:cytoskeletal protein RodZ